MHGYFDDAERLYIVLDYAQGGDLYRMFKKNEKRFDELTAGDVSSLGAIVVELL